MIFAYADPPYIGMAHRYEGGVGEPVIFCGGRKRMRGQDTVRDWVAEGITRGRGLVGVKPDEFCYWLFSVLNAQPGDELHDIFPGSGAVTRAFQTWIRQYGRQPDLLTAEPVATFADEAPRTKEEA